MHAPPDARDPDAAGTPPHEDALARATEKIEAVVRLAGGVAHDFNNLLTVIVGNAQSLLDDLPLDSAHRTEIGEIAEAARRASTLTHQLLAFSRQLVLRPRLVNPAEILAQRWDNMAADAGSGVTLERVVDPASGPVRVDPQLFDQVVTQLVRNAIDATRGAGRITVTLENAVVDEVMAANHRPMAPGEYVVLDVTDDGVGMDVATRKRAFEPFFTTKDQKHGTGMGLPTVYGIVKQSGGYIWLESEPGVGTRCRVYLPRERTPAAATRQREPVVAAASPDPALVLVVEDEDLVRILTCRTLARAGYRVVEAPNGSVALDLVRRQGIRPGLLLTDIVMPGMNGNELAAILEREIPGLPVILTSGFVDQRVPLVGVGGGRWSFMAKPFSPDDLRRCVREALGATPRSS
jgi:two-component system cell cycle sensor histidine kinase/response regulator CckA